MMRGNRVRDKRDSEPGEIQLASIVVEKRVSASRNKFKSHNHRYRSGSMPVSSIRGLSERRR
jgi:hypothetical protein